MTWYAIDVEIESAAHEAVEYALMEAGALGSETGNTDKTDDLARVTAYFSEVPNRESIRSVLHEALRIYELPSSSVRDMTLREVADRDWLAEWKKNWQPVEVGRFVIAPPWSEINDAPDRIIVRIEPGRAFGTGTHETTRLCLEAIEKHAKTTIHPWSPEARPVVQVNGDVETRRPPMSFWRSARPTKPLGSSTNISASL